MLLSDTVALVTGSSRGAGAAIARALAAHGAAVCVNYFQSEDKADAVVAEIEEAGGRAFAFGADVTDPGAVRQMVEATVERFGRIDVAVNNALPDYSFDPSAPYVSVETVEWSHFQRQIVIARGRSLSDRELEVFEMIGRGFTTREVAERLSISPKTVESHRARIKAKLDIDNSIELMRRAIQWVETIGVNNTVGKRSEA